MNRAKKHHHAPRVYLSNFADRDGRVQVYDRVTERTLNRQHIRNVAAESNLYTFMDADGNASDAFEQGPLATIDGDMAALLPKLLEPMPALSMQEREIVNTFLALQFVRTPAARDSLADTFDLALRLEVEMNVGGASPEKVERFIDKRYPEATESERQVIRQIAADPARPVPLRTEEWVGSIMGHLPDLVSLLETREWIFVDAEDGSFLTCDNPVVLVGPWPVGLANAVYITWPLSPKRLLWLGLPNSFDGERFQKGSAPADLVSDLNQMAANQAIRQIIWHPDTNPIGTITLPSGPFMTSVDGIPVGPGERSYDKVRDKWQHIRDVVRERQTQQVDSTD